MASQAARGHEDEAEEGEQALDEAHCLIRNILTQVICTDVLSMADLHSINSHGVARLPGYIRLIEEGRIDPSASNEIIRERLSTANINANRE